MQSTQTIRLGYPPSANGIFAQSRVSGRRFRSKRYNRWMEAALWEIRAARLKTMEGPCRVKITLTPPDKRKRDIDNLIKPVLDCLVKGGVLHDDSSQYVRSVSSEWDHSGQPKAIVEISRV